MHFFPHNVTLEGPPNDCRTKLQPGLYCIIVQDQIKAINTEFRNKPNEGKWQTKILSTGTAGRLETDAGCTPLGGRDAIDGPASRGIWNFFVKAFHFQNGLCPRQWNWGWWSPSHCEGDGGKLVSGVHRPAQYVLYAQCAQYAPTFLSPLAHPRGPYDCFGRAQWRKNLRRGKASLPPNQIFLWLFWQIYVGVCFKFLSAFQCCSIIQFIYDPQTQYTLLFLIML